ncbi:hypothetical protein AVEN_248574-1 [Araneus ventricosus]|uniref:Uncharacterized protein n=1 Tax=Araneus ventricosus TaxID=182803 RepID=A0A4Y2TAH4_ARAVE|nr:hypothetical protein AVEN_248574-1 [Araneus ventricosus]
MDIFMVFALVMCRFTPERIRGSISSKEQPHSIPTGTNRDIGHTDSATSWVDSDSDSDLRRRFVSFWMNDILASGHGCRWFLCEQLEGEDSRIRLISNQLRCAYRSISEVVTRKR